jgi:alpha-1,2-mannosyltransferase
LGRLGRAALPVVALAVLAAVVGFSLWAASAAGTLGYDFLAYHQAASRVLGGERLYDPTVQATGGFGLFYYPPPFVLAILPFGLLDPTVATWVWAAFSMAAFLAGVALMPVSSTVRWATVLLAGLSWPFAYAMKLGQVGPLLFFMFAVGWRWLEDPRAVGGSAAAGAIVKLQPGLLLVWAALTRRWNAVAVGLVVLIAAATIATVVTGGPSVWTDYVALLRNVSDPIATPHNFTPGAVAYQSGVSAGAAAAIQVASSVAAAVVVVVAALRATAAASYLAAVVASQLLSPVLWDHYAMLLLLPVAYLLDKGHWWAVAITLATSATLLFSASAAVYPLAFWLTLIAVLVVGIQAARAPGPAPAAA